MQTLRLLISALISSWQFFKESTPSPRIEFSLHKSKEEQSNNWQEFCLRPQRRSALKILRSFFFNPRWNESLYIMDCAERIIVSPREDYIQEIMQRIKTELKLREINFNEFPYLQFRLAFLSKDSGTIQKDILFKSELEKVL